MKKILFILICILGISTIILLNWYDAPTMSDDLPYHFVFQKNLIKWDAPLEPIQNINDVIKSQIIHYQYINGRSLTHSIAQIMLNLIPLKLAKFLNAVLFLLLVYLTAKYVRIRKENQFFLMTLVFGLLFLVISGFYTGFIWLLGSMIYLLALVITICFLFLLRWLGERSMNWKLLPLIPLSFLMGWTHEAIALPLSAAWFLYLVFHYKTVFRQANAYCMLAYMLGMLMIIMTPALWNRADLGGITLSQRIFSGFFNIVFGLRISWILVLSLLILFFKNKKHFLEVINHHKYLLTAWIVAVFIVFSCGINIDRVPICADFIAMLMLLQLLQAERLKRYRLAAMLLIAFTTVMVAVPAIQLNAINYHHFQYHQQQLSKTDSHLIKVRQMQNSMNPWMKSIAKRYVFQTIEFSFYNCYMAFDKNDINNKAIAKLYHKQEVVFLPEDVMNRIEKDSTAYRTMESDENEKLYILQLKDNQQVNNVTFLLGEEVPLKFYQRLLTYPNDYYELDSFNYEVLDICNRRYLVMTIPPSNISRRIKQINIE